MLEEFQCNWFYLAGKLNVLADAFSRLPRFDFAGAEERKDDLSMQKVSFDPDAPVQLGASMFSSDPYLGLADVTFHEASVSLLKQMEIKPLT